MTTNGVVLVVDDDRSMCEMLAAGLAGAGLRVIWRTDGEEALVALQGEDVDVVVADLQMPRMGGLALCERVVANRPDVPVVVLTGFGNLESAQGAIRAGAYDFVSKPVEVDALVLVLARAIEHRELRGQLRRLRTTVMDARRFEDIVGESPVMHRMYGLLERVAPTPSNVLITGESGTGKELVARAIHRRSARGDGPFVAVNCAALPDSLLESELFGHARGAFTDARGARRGLFVEAAGGTLLLDEIGELPMALQPKLLRAIQERVIRPVGGDGEVSVDIRILAATNRDIEAAVEAGRFREDLCFRLNVIQVVVPPLRSRGTDVLLLAKHFVASFAAGSGRQAPTILPAVAERLLAYSWPGNVRELRNAMERALILAKFDALGVDDLPERIRAYGGEAVLAAGTDPEELGTLEEMERRYILHVLRAVGGNKTEAARVLGLERKTLYRKLDQYESGGVKP